MNSLNQPVKDNNENGLAAGEKPKSPRALLAAVIIMGVLLVVGFTVVISTIIYRVSNAGAIVAKQPPITPAANVTKRIETLIADGSQIRAMELNNTHLVVHIAPEASGRGEIIIYDLRKGIEQTRIILKTR